MALDEPHRFVKLTQIELSTKIKFSIPGVTKFNMVIAPCCSRVGERRVDQKIEKLECQTPKNSS